MRPIDLQQRLLADHRRLEQLFTKLMDAFEADAREDTQRLWTELEAGLEAHFAAEERHLFAAYGNVDATETRALSGEHALLRARLAELGVGVDLKLVRAEVAKGFIGMLRAHAAREDALLYQWAKAALSDEEVDRVTKALTPPSPSPRGGEGRGEGVRNPAQPPRHSPGMTTRRPA